MIFYYDMQGKPMTMEEWGKAFQDTEARIVGKKKLYGGLVEVSTVWMGMDHDYSWNIWNSDKPNPRPVIFETMVFLARKGGGEMNRYSTLEEARAGHKAMVKAYLNPIRVLKAAWGKY